MGPLFALGDALGLPRVARRTGCGWALLLALGAWGVVRLLDALRRARRAALGARRRRRAVRRSTPTSSSYTEPHDVTLLAYAALPWLLLCVHRGLREPRAAGGGRRAFALVVTAAGRRRERGGDRRGCCSGRCCSLLYERALRRVPAGARVRAVRVAPAAAGARSRRCGGSCRCSCRPRYGARLPALHRAAGHDLVDDVAARVAAADGLLDLATSASATAGALRPYSGRRRRAASARAGRARRRCSCPRSRSAASRWTRRWRYAPFFLRWRSSGCS